LEKLPSDPDYIKTIEDYHDLIKQKFPELSKKDVIKKGEDILKLYKNGSAIGNYASDSQFATVDQFANGQNNSLSGSFTDTANGTGDYYEIYAYYSESFTVTDAVFGGYKLIGV